MIGNRLWEDMIFGNLNKMATINVTQNNKADVKRSRALSGLEAYLSLNIID